MSNLTIPADQWLRELFEYEFCAECAGGADDHVAIPFVGNWFAGCLHPIDGSLSGEEIMAEERRRIERQEAGLPMVETPRGVGQRRP